MSVTRRALRKIELPEREQGDRWSNEDIRPVPPERQTWGMEIRVSQSHAFAC